MLITDLLIILLGLKLKNIIQIFSNALYVLTIIINNQESNAEQFPIPLPLKEVYF